MHLGKCYKYGLEVLKCQLFHLTPPAYGTSYLWTTLGDGAYTRMQLGSKYPTLYYYT